MPFATELSWLPERPQWLAAARTLAAGTPDWADLTALARARIGMVETARLDRLLLGAFPHGPGEGIAGTARLAVLASSTADHLLPGLRVGALRRGLFLATHTGGYGQYLPDLLDARSPLHDFRPDTILFAFDAAHLFGTPDPAMTAAEADALLDHTADRITRLWRLARTRFGCRVIQQTVLPASPALGGGNEHRLHGSRAALIARLNARLRRMADAEQADLLALDEAAARTGLAAWLDPALWHRAKQEISPAAGPLYGDLTARLIAARRGLSCKCLVLDLDNTLWHGVIGDDGIGGIGLGQGSAVGEAHLAFQSYCRDLSRRGVILAVCSKNDEANARAPFEHHPDMLLRMSDIACFVANWNDKADNIRLIAERLRIGLDAIAFADDNPFERDLVRRELPMVTVPELPDDPALYADCIASSGCFEAAQITEEDRGRSGQYQAALLQEGTRASFTDLAGYLGSLDMRMTWRAFDPLGLPRIVQLINKTNQFNLTTRRHDEAAVQALIDDPQALTMQIRLVDRLGDHGMIAAVIGRMEAPDTLFIDTWLMSCRVLGRQVEHATMNVLAAQARRQGVSRIVGEYHPTARNGMVRNHYRDLGFREAGSYPGGSERWECHIPEFTPLATCIAVEAGQPVKAMARDGTRSKAEGDRRSCHPAARMKL